MSRVFVIPDLHCPVMLPKFLTFLQRTRDKHRCTKVVSIGDIVDWSSISYHPKAPSLKNSEAEFEKAYKQVAKVVKAFPRAQHMIGNHDCLTERQAGDAGLPLSVLKSFGDLWGLGKKWTVHPRYADLVIDGVIYRHGDKGKGGQHNPALANAQCEHASVVQGHFHACAGVNYFANLKTRIFGLQVGCGVDHDTAAMSYGAKFSKKPILGCGVVIDGETAIFEPMKL